MPPSTPWHSGKFSTKVVYVLFSLLIPVYQCARRVGFLAENKHESTTEGEAAVAEEPNMPTVERTDVNVVAPMCQLCKGIWC